MKASVYLLTLACTLLFATCDNFNDESTPVQPAGKTVKSLKSKPVFVSQPLADKNISDFEHSMCKDNGALDFAEAETIHLQVVSKKNLLIEHNNAMFNCTDLFTVSSDIKDKNIIKIEEQSQGELTDCYCHYDLKYVVNKIKYGPKTIMLKTGNTEASRNFSFDVVLSADLDMTIVVK